MTAPLFITTEKRTNTLPLLIVDKPGLLSKGLVSLLSEHFTTVLLSEKKVLSHLPRVTYFPYRRSIPKVPDDYFTAIILFYYGEKGIADGINSFIKKAKENDAKLLIITSREHAKTPFINHALETYEHAHVIIYGDIFGVTSHEESVVTRMLSETAHKGRITVHGSGLSESYPVYYADVLQAVLHVFLSHRPPKIGLAYPTHPTPEIHVARLVQKLHPGIEVAFYGKEEKSRPREVLEGTVLVEDPYPLGDKLQRLKKTPATPVASTIRTRKIPTIRLGRKAMLIGGVVGGSFLLLFFLSVFLFLIGLLNLQVAVNAGKQDNLELVMKRSQTAWVMFRAAENSSGPIRVVGNSIGLGDVVDTYISSVAAGKTASSVATYLADAGIAYQDIVKQESSVPQDAMVRISADVKHALLGIDRLRADNAIPAKYLDSLMQYERPLERLSGIIENLAYLGGARQDQRYLVLFQNNMELRPGGGFIGSYGLLTMRNGAIASFTINDVYNADGQLTGHVEPPFALRRYLGATHWYLRDSNYSIEFSQNAAQAAAFLQLSTGEKVDGVIAMDVSFLVLLLEKTGPVYVPALNKTVDSKNFYAIAQSQAEDNFFPGSTKKKDFLEHVAQALVLSFEEREQLPIGQLILAADQVLSEKHLMIASANPALMEILIANGFAPSVRQSEGEKRATIADISGIVEANVGANKANFYVTRHVNEQLTLQADGKRNGTMTISYQNTSAASSPYGGDYKNYLRVVLPGTATLTGVSIDGNKQTIVPAVTSARVFTTEQFIPPVGLEVDREDVLGRALYGFYVEIPKGETRTIAVTYEISPPVELPESFTYLHRVYKQPGTGYDPYRLQLDVAPGLLVTKTPSFVSRVGNSLQVTRDIAEDLTLSISFLQQ